MKIMNPTDLLVLMIKKDVRQIDIARLAGVDRAYVNRIVHGQQPASRKVIQALKKFNLLEGDKNV